MTKPVALLAGVLMMFAVSWGQAAEVKPASIEVKEMHCIHCAQKIAAKLFEIKGVKDVTIDVKKKTLYVTASEGVTLSPLAMWEAVEKAKDKPVLLVCATGTYKEKPKS